MEELTNHQLNVVHNTLKFTSAWGIKVWAHEDFLHIRFPHNCDAIRRAAMERVMADCGDLVVIFLTSQQEPCGISYEELIQKLKTLG